MEVFAAGGIWMYLVLMAGVPALIMSVVHAIAARKWSFIVSLCLALLVILLGGLGTLIGCIKTIASVAGVDPALKAPLLKAGIWEAFYSLIFATIISVISLVLLKVGQVRKRRRG